jgi:hypothetical protein
MYERTLSRYLDLCFELLIEPVGTAKEKLLNQEITNLRGTLTAQINDIEPLASTVSEGIDTEVSLLRDC